MNTKKALTLLDPVLLKPAIVASFTKLSPRVQWRNPVMFVVFIGSIFTTLLWLQALQGKGEAPAGFILTVVLSLLRTSFVWWPFHPAGYALALSYAMEYFWLPVMIAWLLKFLIVRYGGVKMYRAAIPFFLGLILGDYTMGSLWAIVGPLLGIPTYKIYI